MFRIDVDDGGKATITMKIAGRLGAQCGEEIMHQVARCRDPRRVAIDLSEVTFIDNSGEKVLSWLGNIGARFIVDGFYCLGICERLDLPVLKSRDSRRKLVEAVK
jgi:hypothetical protein